MDEAREELEQACRRQREIDRRIAEAVQKLKDRAEARKGKRGRMTVAEQAKEASPPPAPSSASDGVAAAGRQPSAAAPTTPLLPGGGEAKQEIPSPDPSLTAAQIVCNAKKEAQKVATAKSIAAPASG